VTVAQFAGHLDSELARLACELASGLYRPGPMRTVRIEKPGGHRRLAIPCVRDRVVQSGLAEMLTPIAERVFEPFNFAYRKGRSVDQTAAAIARYRDEGYRHVVACDIERFFDSIPHDKMIGALSVLVAEPEIADLVQMWLDAADCGEHRGVPQGSPISPLLANLYFNSLDEHFERAGLKAVRFANDFVLLCRSEEDAASALADATVALAKLGLTLNPEKTRIVSSDEGFHFLGRLFVRDVAAGSADAGLAALVHTNLAHPATRRDAAETGSTAIPLAPPVPPAAEPGCGDAADADEMLPAGPQRAPVLCTLYLREPGRMLDLRNETFSISADGHELLAAMPGWFDRIEVGPDVEVTSRALRHALVHGIAVVFVTAGERAIGTLSSDPARHGRRHLAQARAIFDPECALSHAAAFVAGRLANQKALLYRLNRRRKDDGVATAALRIGRIARRVDLARSIDELRGIEGEGAALYWPALGLTIGHGFGLSLRGRREKANPVAVVLDMLAHLLTRDVETLVLRHGLHPSFGFLHVSRHSEGAPAAYDLVEAFRAPLAEGLAVYLFNNRILQHGHFGAGDDGQVRLFPVARDRVIRTYEAWMNRMLKDPESSGEITWRELISNEVRRFGAALEADAPFTAYQMGY